MNNHQKVSAIATSIIALSTFLATLGAVIYYAIQSFKVSKLGLLIISEIYILIHLLFMSTN